MLHFCSCCETLATLNFFFFSFILKHYLIELWTKPVFSKYLHSAYLDGLLSFGIVACLCRNIKIRNSQWSNKLLSKGSHQEQALVFHIPQLPKSCEIPGNADSKLLHYTYACIQLIAEIHSPHWWLQYVTDLSTVCCSCALSAMGAVIGILGRKLFSDVICG